MLPINETVAKHKNKAERKQFFFQIRPWFVFPQSDSAENLFGFFLLKKMKHYMGLSCGKNWQTLAVKLLNLACPIAKL